MHNERLARLAGMNLAIARTRIHLSLGPNREPPREFRLFAAGKNETENGAVIIDPEGMAEAMAWARQYGNRLGINYNHFGRSKKDREAVRKAVESGDGSFDPAHAFKSAGSFVLAMREWEPWAEDVRWTPLADRMIRDEEYIYFSPETWFDPKTGRVFIIDGCALTNQPAIRNLKQLTASLFGLGDDDETEPPAGGDPPPRGTTMAGIETSILAQHIFLSRTSPEELVLATITDNAHATRQLLSVTGKATVKEAIDEIESLKRAAAERDTLRGEMSRQTGEAVGTRMRAMLDAAEKKDDKGRVKVSPAERAWAESHYSLSDPQKPPTRAHEEGLREYLANKAYVTPDQPAQGAPGGAQPPGTPPPNAGASGSGGAQFATFNGKRFHQIDMSDLLRLKENDKELYDRLYSERDKRA